MNRLNKDVSKFRLDGQVALVTGSTRGIGWAIATGMAD
jgi:NAD(P)-dependent dehydrogenase (short-subunit alcohol dehydrogenase family)